MRVTRYLWINNLPARTSEQDIQDVLQSHGKIQSIRIHPEVDGAVVAFADTKSASRAMESSVRINKVNLSLQYCESSGTPCNQSQDGTNNSHDSIKLCNISSTESDESRFTGNINDLNNNIREKPKRSSSQACSAHSLTTRNSNGFDMGSEFSTTRSTTELRGLQIRQLPIRSSDANLREGLFHEYKKHGKITSVLIRGSGEDRSCIITFKRCEDAERALEVSRGKVFFGTAISVALHQGLDSEDPDLCPPEHAMDEYHPKATKTLFVGNLISSTITQDELRQIFRLYGEIIEIDIKVQVNQPGTSYAFVQYSDIRSVVRALADQDFIRVGGKCVKLGFGKSQPTNVVWLNNLAPSVTDKFLMRQFSRYGHLTHVVLDRKALRALLYFNSVEMAQRALNETRNRALIGRKVQLDYAGYECQVAFMRRLAQHDSIGQVYEDYRERLKQLLAFWPTYGNVLPVLDRHRMFADSKTDGPVVPIDNGSPCGRRRMTKYGVNNDHTQSVESTKSRRASVESNHRISYTSKPRIVSRGCHADERSSSTESSLSPSARVRPRSRDSRKVVHSSSSKDVETSVYLHDGTIRHSRLNVSSNYSPFSESSPHISSTGRPLGASIKSIRSSLTRSTVKKVGHYLEEADDVSSGPLSPDQECSDTSSPSVTQHTYNIKSPQRLESSKFRDGDVYRKTKGFINITDGRKYKLNRQDTPVRVSSDVRHVSQKPRKIATFQPQNCDQRKPRTHQSERIRPSSYQDSNINDNDPPHVANMECGHVDDSPTRSYSHSGPVPQPHYRSSKVVDIKTDPEKSVDVCDGVTSATNLSIDANSTESIRRNSSERIHKTSCVSKNSEDSFGSHDTLTKLEMERAKLLRELSILNNEVVCGSKSRLPSSATKRKREVSTDCGTFPLKIKCPDDREKDSPDCVRQSLSPIDNDRKQSTSSLYEQSVSQDHCEMAKPIMSMPSLRSSSSGFMSGGGETGEILSLIATKRLLSPNCGVSVDTIDDTTATTTTVSDVKDPSSGILSSICNSALAPLIVGVSDNTTTNVASPLRAVMPPAPLSPPIRLSLPELDDMDNSLTESGFTSPSTVISNTCSVAPSHGTTLLNTTSNTSIPSICRDPRLAVHHGQSISDLPLPPPPPPEAVNLPLWVNTSRLAESDLSVDGAYSGSLSLARWRSESLAKLPPEGVSIKHGSTESETKKNAAILHDTNCSLDERIRLLDARLMKSEKARPTVDYSKFRIRRKLESAAPTVPGNTETASTTTPALSSSIISTIALCSVTPSSPTSVSGHIFTSPLVDRCPVTESGFVTSPGLSSLPSTIQSTTLSSSPVSVPRLADTSEFVKTMLSVSRLSPATPSGDIANTSSFTFTLPNSRRLASRFLSPACSIEQDAADSGKEVASVSDCQSNSVSRHLFSSLTTRFIPSTSTCMPSINTVVTAATRMAVMQPSTKEVSSVHVHRSSFKSILKHDQTTDGSSPITISVSSVHSEILNTTAPSGTQSTLSRSPTLLHSKRDSERLDSFPPAKTVRPVTKTAVSLAINTVGKGNSKRFLGSTVSSSAKQVLLAKNAKSDVPRPALDDIVFRSSFDHCFQVKSDRPKKPRTDSGSLSSKKCISESSRSIQPPNTQCTDNLKSSGCRTHQKVLNTPMQKNIPTYPKLTEAKKGRDPVKKKLKASLSKGVDYRESDIGTQKSTKQQLSASSPPSKKTKKGKLIRRVPSDSESSDWEPSTSVLSKDLVDAEVDSLACPRYESMYDKIKRRASKNTDKKAIRDKGDSAIRVTNTRDRDIRKLTKKPVNRSDVDSDTDQCLSDNSGDTEKQHTKRNNRLTKPTTFTEKLSETCTRRKVKVKRRAVADGAGMKDSIQDFKKVKEYRSVLTESNNKTREMFDGDSKADAIPPVKSVNRSSQVEKHTIVNKLSSRPKKLLNPSRGSTLNIVTPNLKRNRKAQGGMLSTARSKAISKPGRGSVHRVFPTSDSDSSCKSDSKSLRVRLKRKHRYERANASDRTSKLSVDRSLDSSPSSVSSTHQLSRSCSPDDLDADAAIRHTFGAFAGPPFNSMSSKLTDKASRVASVSLTLQVDPSTINVSSTALTSRSTPPTLSMLESGSSICQSLKTLNKSNPHDAGEWNMFDSIARQSTPKKEPLPLSKATSPPFDPVDAAVNDDQKINSDFEDLPSLDKHDEDEINKPDDNSILLNETDSLVHNGNNVTSLNDDDLPPPVVSVIDLSPQHLSFSDCIDGAVAGAVSDIIEEVVYDGLEVHVPVVDQSYNPPLDTQPEAASCLIKEENLLESHTHEIIADYPEKVASSNSLTAPDSPHEHISHALVDAPVISTLSVSVHSSVNPIPAPLTVVNSAATSIDLPGSEHSALVAVSKTGPSFNIKSPKVAIISQYSPQPANLCNQRHVTLILPATPVVLNGSVSHASTPTVFASPKLLITTSVPDIRENPSVQSVTTIGTCGQRPKSPSANLIFPASTPCSTVVRMSDLVDQASSNVFTMPIDPALCQAATATSQTPTNSVAFDPSDLTSYVQRVIERVKQEKDEEVSNQREKIKRTKKVLTTSLPIASVASIVPAPISPAAFIPPITTLPVIPGVNVCPKPYLVNVQPTAHDQPVSVLRLENVPSSEPHMGVVVSDCSPTTVATVSSTRRNSDLTEPSKTILEPPELPDVFHNENTDERTNYNMEKSHVANEISRDTVDEVIDAVLNGRFDETEYRQRLQKGVFDACSYRSRLTISSPVGLLDHCTSGNTNDECPQQIGTTGQVGVNVGKCDVAFSIPNSQSEAPPSSIFDGSNLISDSQAHNTYKPMHVLTFVATGASPTVCSQLSTTNAVSPSVSSPCNTPRPSATSNLAHPPVPTVIGGLQSGKTLPGVCEPLTPRLVPTPQCTTSRPISHTEVSAADLADMGSHLDKFSPINIPLTNYIYSLLAQQQKQITTITNPLSVSSCDTPGITTTTGAGYELHNGSSVIPPFKPFAIPPRITCTVSSSSEAADYYAAAATMAAMAAMVSPSAGLSGSSPPSMSLTSSSANTVLPYPSNYKDEAGQDLNSLESSRQHEQFWLDQTFTVQGYQLAWQGRLALKNEEVHVQMHFIGGTQDLLKSCMGVISDAQKLSATNQTVNTSLLSPPPAVLDSHVLVSQPLKIVQRMRLEESQLEGVQRKLRQASDFCMCITLATAPPHTPASQMRSMHVHMNRILCDGFIKYMVDKSAAGIINVCHPINQQNLFVVHIFAPCEFSRRQLELFAPALAHQLDQQRTPHLLVVITTV